MTTDTKLHQILAIEKGAKQRAHGEMTALHRDSQREGHFRGHHKTFKPLSEEGETYPDDTTKVQLKAGDVLSKLSAAMTGLLDITASKDWANCDARADVIVDGEILLADAPVTFLLTLEKQVTDLHTFVSKCAELESSEVWTLDPNSGLHRADPVRQHRTKKMMRAIVKYDATEFHPAQTEMISEDVVIGHWTTTKFSGALPRAEKELMLQRAAKLLEAVKEARSRANGSKATKKQVGAKMLNYVFGT